MKHPDEISLRFPRFSAFPERLAVPDDGGTN